MSNFIRSPWNYIGNKFRILNEIVPKLNKTSDMIFADVFGGSGVVSANVENKKIIYNELDENVYKMMQEIHDADFQKIDKNIKNIISKYKFVLPNADNYKDNSQPYEKLKKDFNEDNDVYKFMVLVFYGFNSQIRYNSAGQFNIPVGKSGYTENRRENLKKFCEIWRKKDVEFFNEDFLKIVPYIYKNYKNVFFYFDPPYLISTAPYNAGWNEKDEEALLDLLTVLLKKKIPFGLNNFISRGSKKNTLLEEFINSNRQSLIIKKMNSSYKNSNYHRKAENEALEIYIEYRGN